MNERVTRLRQQSLNALPWLSIERAALITEFYSTAPETSVPVRRALALRRLMERKKIYLGDGELIVGERGPSPKSYSHISGVVLPFDGRLRNSEHAREDLLHRGR